MTVREVQHRLKDVLALVERGESVDVTRRGKVVARLTPPPISHRREKPVFPDFMARLKRDFPQEIRGKPVSEIVDEGRGER